MILQMECTKCKNKGALGIQEGEKYLLRCPDCKSSEIVASVVDV